MELCGLMRLIDPEPEAFCDDVGVLARGADGHGPLRL